ncbi:MAG: hypothetical protein U0P30_13210 [Vicinamibacterales bacterium]
MAPILDILQGSRRLAGVIRRNIAFSLVYNLSASSLAVAGLVGPLLAAVLMPLVPHRRAVVDAHAHLRAAASPGDGTAGGLTWRPSSSCCHWRC